MNYLELRIPPVVQVLVVGSAMWLLSEQFPATKSSDLWNMVAALVAFSLGAIFALLGVLEFKKAQTTVDPRVPEQTRTLVVSGVYRLSRNPMYIGFLFMLIAWALYLAQLHLVLFLPLFVVYMNRFQIAPEERFMRQKFGEEYVRYMTSVRRWL